MISAVITAGGSSLRFKNGNKLLYKIGEKTVLKMTVDKFLSLDFIDEIIITANKDIINIIKENIKSPKIKVIEGGETRQKSVFNGLKACTDCKYVIIHDGARPFVSTQTIEKTINKVRETKACIVAVKTTDTIKIADDKGFIVSTPDRKTLWNAQTPQTFEYDLIFKLHKKHDGKNFTDDSLLCEYDNIPVAIVEGEYENIKITTSADVKSIC